MFGILIAVVVLVAVGWAPVDAQSALLYVPFGEETETFVVRFNPQTGLLDTLEAMRYRKADDTRRTLWINEMRRWAELDGATTGTEGAAIWFDQGQPWAVFRVKESVYNVDVTAYVRAKGL